MEFSAAWCEAATQAWEVSFGLEGDVPWCLICLICFVSFVSIFYLIDYFFSFWLGLGFWVWNIGVAGVFLLGPALLCAVR
jgi:hypothetical protein